MPQKELDLYEGRLAGVSQTISALESGDRQKLGVFVLSCSEF
jgi:hypothetical protein